MAKPPLNYTTKITARQTVGECSDLLAEAGTIPGTIPADSSKSQPVAFQASELQLSPAGTH